MMSPPVKWVFRMSNRQGAGNYLRKRSLRIMTLKRDPSRCIGDVMRSDQRMVGDLLNDECRQTACVCIWPMTAEKSAERNAGIRYPQDTTQRDNPIEPT